MTARAVVAIDLGAESGRVVLGRFDGGRVALEEVHRFPTPPRPHDGHLRWDLDGLWSQIRAGLAAAGEAAGSVDAVGVDAWGVDYGLLGQRRGAARRPHQLPRPAHHRHGRGGHRPGWPGTAVPGHRHPDHRDQHDLPADGGGPEPGRSGRADRLLLIPDLFHHLLSGATVAEYTVASTTGAYDMAGGRWAVDLLGELGVPAHLLPEVVDAGTDLGPVKPELPGFASAKVIAPASHDTASAVVGVPFADPDAAYRLLGHLVAGRRRDHRTGGQPGGAWPANLTNEGGAFGTIRLLRNSARVCGCCRRAGGSGPGRAASTATTSLSGWPRQTPGEVQHRERRPPRLRRAGGHAGRGSVPIAPVPVSPCRRMTAPSPAASWTASRLATGSRSTTWRR